MFTYFFVSLTEFKILILRDFNFFRKVNVVMARMIAQMLRLPMNKIVVISLARNINFNAKADTVSLYFKILKIQTSRLFFNRFLLKVSKPNIFATKILIVWTKVTNQRTNVEIDLVLLDGSNAEIFHINALKHHKYAVTFKYV